MGWFSQAVRAANVASSQNFGDKAQRLAGSLAKHYSTTSTDQQTLQYIVLFIERAEKKYPKTLYGNLLNALIYAYDSQQTKYPAHFYIDKAMRYLDEKNERNEEPKKSAPTPTHWYKQKSEEVEHHLKHIALMKLQLAKNLKDLQSQNGGHLWIDTDFIDPATETLQASLTQVQDLEDRLYLLNLTYQDHL